MRDTEKFKRKALISNDPKDWANCEEFRNQVNNKIKITKKKTYYQNAFQDNKGSFRKTWQNINDLPSRNSNNLTVKELKLDGNTTLNSQQVSEAFNNHFANIGPRLASKIHSDMKDIHYRKFL